MILNALLGTARFRAAAGGQRAGRPWRRWIDTALASPDDIVPWDDAPAFAERSYHTEARSVVCLWASGS